MSHERVAADGEAGLDRTTMLGAAVTMLALAGLCALLGSHFVLGALRLAAGVLAGLGLGAALLAVLSGRRARLGPRPRLLVAVGAALVLALALTVPAVLVTRVEPLADRAELALAPLVEGDSVHSLPLADSPVLVRRADGSAQVLLAGIAHRIDADAHDVLALSADGRRLVRATGAKVARAHLRHLNPLPADLGEVLRRYDRVVLPEMNLGQLALLLRARYLVDVRSHTAVRGLPFTAVELAQVLHENLMDLQEADDR